MTIVTIVVIAHREKHNINHMCWHKRGTLHFDDSSELICEPKVEFIKQGCGTSAIASYRMWSLWVTKDKGEGWWSIVGSRGWFVGMFIGVWIFLCVYLVCYGDIVHGSIAIYVGFDPHNWLWGLVCLYI